ncbi:MAG: hypothetical protein IPM71_11990 [Bacteroidota bacterium]|nr:MAG: hypothetical protein IPM71_11990 [Bacteroidota bacterium]
MAVKFAPLMLFLISLASTHAFCQFSLPKAPAEMVTYFQEAEVVKKSGLLIRRDIRYKIEEGMVLGESYTEKVVKYFADGRPKEIVHYDKTGRKISILIFSYDANGLPQSETEFHPTGEVLQKTTYQYENNYLIRELGFDAYGNTIYQTIFENPEPGQSIIERTYLAPGMVAQKDIWTYTSADTGILTRHTQFDGESSMKFSSELIYSDNKLQSEIFTKNINSIYRVLEYVYDLSGNASEVNLILPDGSKLPYRIFEYRPDGLLSGKIEYDGKGKMILYMKYQYE